MEKKFRKNKELSSEEEQCLIADILKAIAMNVSEILLQEKGISGSADRDADRIFILGNENARSQK